MNDWTQAMTELVAAPAEGRLFERTLRAGLADAAPGGRVRLDALARWLQDIAYDDLRDAGLVGSSAWVVRRTRMSVQRFPRFGEQLACRTFCSGLGRMWAERRTTLVAEGRGAPDVEAVSLWICMDVASGRPVPLDEQSLAVFRPSTRGRRVRARLSHAPPSEDVCTRPWRFRRTEVDLAGHINNSAYWQPLEDELLAGPEPRSIDAEIEFRVPCQPGDAAILSAGSWRWISAPDREGPVYASLLLEAS